MYIYAYIHACIGTAFALFNLSDDIGKGGGPMLVAMLVRTFGDRRYCINIELY
jgi:MFS-type transporter involved in bile tolerance (Atg22 family)